LPQSRMHQDFCERKENDAVWVWEYSIHEAPRRVIPFYTGAKKI